MIKPSRFDVDSPGGVRLAGYRWDPEAEPRAIAQIAHGVGEYARRYEPLVQDLLGDGYVVYSHDHRAHGATAASPAEFGQLGQDGWTELVADLGRVGEYAKTEHPELPLALVAHSLGSFAAQQWLLDHSAVVSAVVLSGTAAIDLLEPMIDLDAPMDLSAFNAPFAPARTEFDWLSRDPDQVDAYIADPWCGFGLDAAGNRAAFAGSHDVADPDRVAAMRHDLPMYLVVGAADPLNGQLALVNELVRRYEDAGLADVTLVSYPDARHEVFNETNRADVVAGVLAWLDRVLPR